MSLGPAENGPEDHRPDDAAEPQRSQRDAITPTLGQIRGGPSAHPPARTVQLVAGDFLITVNPVDGSEIEVCPPGRRPGVPFRRTAEERADQQRATRPPVPPGPAAPPLPLLERDEERARLIELLGHGRSIRLTGPTGSGRTTLLEAVAAECADLAPDGVIRLSGYHRTTTELLHELHAAVFRYGGAGGICRPDRPELLAQVRHIGAVVVVDDLEFGGDALDDLLSATPECAYLLAPEPDAEEPSAGAGLKEVPIGGLTRAASLELLARAVERPLTHEEVNWAGDLWFESEGLPLRFVQAGALLRQRDQLRANPDPLNEFEPFEPFARRDPQKLLSGGAAFGSRAEEAGDAERRRPMTTPETEVPRPKRPDEGKTTFSQDAVGSDTPLLSLGEGAAPAALLASRLSPAARATLRFAVALGGEVPHQAHLPALIGDTHADSALGELMNCALLSPTGTRYRLAPTVVVQLEAHGYADDAVANAHTVAQHYSWWVGHPSVTPERAASEADAILASMAPLVPGQESGQPSAAVLLARSAAPAFLAGLRWDAWERALRLGQEAARIAGEVAEEAYFHHELGILALCVGNLDRARAELEASIAMRGALADKIGTVAGRRALTLVTDRDEGLPALPVGSVTPIAALPPAPFPSSATLGPASAPGREMTLVTRREPVLSPLPPLAVAGPVVKARRALLGGARRNLVAAGTGVVLAAVLGTVVTLVATAGNANQGSDNVTTDQSASPDNGGGGLPTGSPGTGSTHRPGGEGAPAVPPRASGAPPVVGGVTPSGTSVLPASTTGGGHTQPTGNGNSPGHSGDPSVPADTSSPTKTGTSDSPTPSAPSSTATSAPTPTDSTPTSGGSPSETSPPTDTVLPGGGSSASDTDSGLTAGTPTVSDSVT